MEKQFVIRRVKNDATHYAREIDPAGHVVSRWSTNRADASPFGRDDAQKVIDVAEAKRAQLDGKPDNIGRLDLIPA